MPSTPEGGVVVICSDSLEFAAEVLAEGSDAHRGPAGVELVVFPLRDDELPRRAATGPGQGGAGRGAVGGVWAPLQPREGTLVP